MAIRRFRSAFPPSHFQKGKVTESGGSGFRAVQSVQDTGECGAKRVGPRFPHPFPPQTHFVDQLGNADSTRGRHWSFLTFLEGQPRGRSVHDLHSGYDYLMRLRRWVNQMSSDFFRLADSGSLFGGRGDGRCGRHFFFVVDNSSGADTSMHALQSLVL